MTALEEITQLESQFTSATGPDEQAERALAIVRKHHTIRSKEGGMYIDLLFELAKSLGKRQYEAWAHYSRANQYFLSADYREAMEEGNIALTIFTGLCDKESTAMCYDNLGRAHQGNGDYGQAISVHMFAKGIWEEAKDNVNLANSYNNLGANYLYQGNYLEALSHYKTALAIRQKIGDKPGTADCYNNVGGVYSSQGNFPEALTGYLAALRIREEIGDKLGIANSLTNIGTIYQKQGKYEEALSNHRAAINIGHEIGHKYIMAAGHINMGNACYVQGDFPGALPNYETALELMKEVGNKPGIAMSYSNVGAVYHEMGNYELSLSHLFSALRVSEATGFKDVIAEACITIGANYTGMKDFRQAEDYLGRALSISEEIGAQERVQAALRALYKLKKAEGDGMAALDYHERFVALREKLNSEETHKRIAGLQFGYQIEKKEQEVAFERERKDALQAAYDLLGEEKHRSESLLLNILPAEVADELKEKGSAAAKLYENVTVMLTDFKDFTLHSELMSPQALVNELHECFKAFDGIMSKYGIEKIKTVGDAYLAVSGLPHVNPDHAQDMVKAAIEIRDFMIKRKDETRKGGPDIFEVRIGLHSGHVVAGIVGVRKFAYDIWGDAVNTAARMEQNCEAGRINISETTYDLVKDKFTCAYRGEIGAKNKGKLKMYYIEY